MANNNTDDNKKNWLGDYTEQFKKYHDLNIESAHPSILEKQHKQKD